MAARNDDVQKLQVASAHAKLQMLYRERSAAGGVLLTLTDLNEFLLLRWTLVMPGGFAYNHRQTDDDGEYITQMVVVRSKEFPQYTFYYHPNGDYWSMDVRSPRGWVPRRIEHHPTEFEAAKKALIEALAVTKIQHWDTRKECSAFTDLHKVPSH